MIFCASSYREAEMVKRFYKKGAEPQVSNREAVVALERNNQIISDEVTRNLNLALIYLVHAVDRLSIDVERLYNRLPGGSG